MERTADYWIHQLKLVEHVEGGAFREVYRSNLQLAATSLPGTFGAARSASTSIYFLLKQDQFSAFHRIKSDECWHFYQGDPLVVYELEKDGSCTQHLLGNDPSQGQQFQCVVKAGSWFASRVKAGGQYALVGCTVAPGFDFADFELANRSALAKDYPAHQSLIHELTR
ncbi:cupin domain-containing protein [Paraflavitalea sp. CAU 1676]|uniref:cupin domain-containing protein n=1 Tax=Paraflavitalea sp. CAU 1676 TaxID=3032598 RepID=UPI0023D9E178|nr:cupin domain-containing protein [Paraflavitalea sp. CAU 1676]MDF2187800.1 cupin domain-containing protein [Paraflavitalea sp. CAU 1676]